MMKKVLSLVLCAAMLCSAALCLSSCGSADEGAEIPVYFCGEVYDFDPTRAYTDDNAVKIMSLLYEPLFRLDDNGKVTNALAANYRIVENPEENEYKMIIRLRDTYWSSNGAQVTADDVVFAWKRILACDFQSQAAPLLFDIKNAVAVKQGDITIDQLGISADRQELTIEFEGKIDYDAFLRNLTSIALVPLRENNVSRFRDDYWSKLVGTINCNGPFTLRAVEHPTNGESGSFILARNTYYNRPKGSTGDVTQFVNPNTLETVWLPRNSSVAESFQAFLDGTVFYTGEIPLENRAEYKNQAVITDLFSTYCYLFNVDGTVEKVMRDEKGQQITQGGRPLTEKANLFGDYRVRLALSMVINRDHIVENIVYGKAATGLIPGTVYGSSVEESFRDAGGKLISTTSTDEDLAAAKALIKAAGIQKPSDYSFTISYNKTEEDAWVANYVASVWRKLGFKVSVKPLTSVVEYKEYDNRDVEESALQLAYENDSFDVLALDWQCFGTDAFAALAAFSTTLNGSGAQFITDEEGVQIGSAIRGNVAGFADEYYESLIVAAHKEKDLAKRTAILHEAEAYLMSAMPIVPLYFNQSAYLVNDDLGGIYENGYGITMFHEADLKNYQQYLKDNQPAPEEDGE